MSVIGLRLMLSLMDIRPHLFFSLDLYSVIVSISLKMLFRLSRVGLAKADRKNVMGAEFPGTGADPLKSKFPPEITPMTSKDAEIPG